MDHAVIQPAGDKLLQNRYFLERGSERAGGEAEGDLDLDR